MPRRNAGTDERLAALTRWIAEVHQLGVRSIRPSLMPEGPPALIDGFSMPAFTRMIWASAAARSRWQSMLGRIRDAWRAMERLSVAHEIRPVAVTYMDPLALCENAQSLASAGLFVLPVRRVAAERGFVHVTEPPACGGAYWKYECVIARKLDDARLFLNARRNQEHLLAGELLGYPQCCREAFHRAWKAGYTDQVWQAASCAAEEGARVLERQERLIHIEQRPELNPLLRYVGVRLIPHLPHSLACECSCNVARKWKALAEAEGYAEEVSAAEMILSWPMEWSVLHGIAEVRTPLFKLSASSIPTAVKWTVRLEGRTYPAEAPLGSCFPWRWEPAGTPATLCRDARPSSL